MANRWFGRQSVCDHNNLRLECEACAIDQAEEHEWELAVLAADEEAVNVSFRPMRGIDPDEVTEWIGYLQRGDKA